MSEVTTPIDSSVPAEEILKVSQPSRRQSEGAGMRVGNRSEFTLVADVAQPDGADRFRERAAKAQAEAGYWEGRLGTVHDLRIALINDDKQFLFAATYSTSSSPTSPTSRSLRPHGSTTCSRASLTAFRVCHRRTRSSISRRTRWKRWSRYASNADATPRDITRSLHVSSAVNTFLDAVQS